MSTTGPKLYNTMTMLMQAVWDPIIEFAQWNTVFEIVDENWAPHEPPKLALDINKIFTRNHRRTRQAKKLQRQQQQESLDNSLSQASSSEAPSASGPVEGEARADPTLWDLGHHHTCPLHCTRNHGPRLRLGPAVTTYTVSRTWDGKRAQAGSIYLATNGMPIPPRIQRSLLMTNQCDWSNFGLQYIVEAVARKIDPNITVTWKIVIPRPRYSFHIRRDANELPGETHHSVLLLVTSRGAKYIMDMSGEQFGVPREHRFLPWQAYRKRYVVRKKYWTGRGVWTLDTWDRREQCQEIDGRDSVRFWGNTQQAVEKAFAEWDVGGDGVGEWWGEIKEIESARYKQKASSLRSAIWQTLSTQFNPNMKGVRRP